MSKNYFLRYKNTVIGSIVESANGLSYRTNKNRAPEVEGELGYPLGLYPVDNERENTHPLISYKPTEEDIRHWLSERVFPPEREGASSLLRVLGLPAYDVWEIAKKTKGVTYNDFYWFSSDPHDMFEDVHPRLRRKNYVSKHVKAGKLVSPYARVRKVGRLAHLTTPKGKPILIVSPPDLKAPILVGSPKRIKGRVE